MSAAPAPFPQSHQTAYPAAEPAQAEHWIEIVSHLDPRYGGLSSAVPELSERLARSPGAGKLAISLAAFTCPGEEVVPAGFDRDRLSFWPVSRKPWLQDRLGDHELQRSFRSMLGNATGVHIHGLWEQSTTIAAEAARALRLPYILSAHGMLEPWALENKRLKKLVYSLLIERRNVGRATCLHALTQAEAQHFIRFGARSPIAIIPNAVECPKDADPTLLLARHPVLEGKRIVLFMARLHPKKGPDLLLEAWARVASQHPDAHLVIAGPDFDGTQLRLEQLAGHHRVAGSVLFPGMLRGAMKWSALAAAEAFVLPSYSEGLSVAVLEAMGMGLPVIITEPCNMPEVAEIEAGWVVPPTVSTLASALEQLLGQPPLHNLEIGTRGAALIQSRYSWPIVARQMADIYHWAAGNAMPTTVDLIFPA